MYKVLIHIILFAALAACHSNKKLPEAAAPVAPEWVGGKPIIPGYYSGIGMAYKSAGADYMAIAKNNALNDLASEISVDVNSTSIFYQLEQGDYLREEFQANTRLKSKENLSGYELVGSWENADQYWVYYRLNQFEYEQLKAERIRQATEFSLEFFSKAATFKAQGDYVAALKFATKALASVKDYMGEPIKVQWQNKEVFLVVELFSFMQQTLSEIKLQPLEKQVFAKRGEALPIDALTFVATGSNGQFIKQLPVYLYYSQERITNNQLQTDDFGCVSYALGKVAGTENTAYLQANVNMVALVSEATTDAFIKKILAKLSGPEARINITILKPSVYISSVEENLGETWSLQPLKQAFKQNFLQNGFDVTTDSTQADYYLSISANTQNGSTQGRFYTTALNAHFWLIDSENNTRYTKQIQGFMGMQLNAIAAGEDAYKKLAAEISKRYFREMRRQVFE